MRIFSVFFRGEVLRLLSLDCCRRTRYVFVVRLPADPVRVHRSLTPDTPVAAVAILELIERLGVEANLSRYPAGRVSYGNNALGVI